MASGHLLSGNGIYEKNRLNIGTFSPLARKMPPNLFVLFFFKTNFPALLIKVTDISANFAGQSTCWIIIVTGAPSSSIRVLKRGQSDFLPVSWPVTSIPCQSRGRFPKIKGFFFIFFWRFSFIHTLVIFPHSF
jgi:hypothetical protein